MPVKASRRSGCRRGPPERSREIACLDRRKNAPPGDARGNRGAGRALSAAALAISGTAAHLGGVLSFGHGVRVNHTFADSGPSEFVAVADEADLHGSDLKTVTVDGTSVLIARSQAGELCAIANTCSHLGGPLGDGARDGDVVACPWHGSRFHLCSGAVIEGPAVFAQPR